MIGKPEELRELTLSRGELNMSANQCRFIKIGSTAYCDSYNCSRKAAWSVGKVEGPKTIRHNLCEKCVEQLIGSIPGDLKIYLGEPAATPEIITPTTPTEYKADVKPAESKIFTCSACGEVFYSKGSRDRHRRTCKGEATRKGGKR